MTEKEKIIHENLEETLFDFVKRVAKGEATSEAEVQVLPEVAAVLKPLILKY